MFKSIFCIIFSVFMMSVICNAAVPWMSTNPAEVQALIDGDQYSNSYEQSVLPLLKAYIENESSIKTFDNLVAFSKKIKGCRPLDVCTLCRNRKIFYVEAFHYGIENNIGYAAVYFNYDDPLMVRAGIKRESYIKLTIKHAPDVACSWIEEGKIALPESEIVAILKQANRYWSAKLLNDTNNKEVEKYVARIRTLLATY